MKSRRSKLTLRRRKRGSLSAKIKSALGWLLLLFVLTALVAGAIVYRRADSEITRVVARALQEQFPQSKVSFDSVRLDSTRGLRLYSIEWRAADSRKNADPLLKADEIYVECPLELRKIVAGQYDIRRVVISHPTLRVSGNFAQLQRDLQTLMPATASTPNRDLSVEIDDADLNLSGTTISGIRVLLTPGDDESSPIPNADENAPEPTDEAPLPEPTPVASAEWNAPAAPVTSNVGFASYQPVFDDPEPALPQDAAAPTPSEENVVLETNDPSAPFFWNVEVKASNPYVKNLRASGAIASPSWKITGAIEDLDLATIVPLARSFFPEKLKALGGAQGKTSLDFTVGSDDGSLSSLNLRVDGELVNAALSSPLLKYPVSEISAQYSVTNDLIEIRKASASCGQTSVKAAFRQLDAFSNAPSATLRAQFENLPVDDRTVVKLVEELKASPSATKDDAEKLDALLDVVQDYRFSGIGNFDVTLKKSNATGGSWAPENVTIDGRNVEFLCVGFPYRLDGLSGRIALDAQETFTFSLESLPNALPAKVQGRFTNVLSRPCGQVDAVVQNRAIDAQVLDAVEEESRKILYELQPSGAADARVRITYDPDQTPDEDKFQVEAAIAVRDASIKYAPFPMPISSISCTIYMRDNAWILSDVSGKSGAATFAAAGSLVSGASYDALGRSFARANEKGADFADSANPAPAAATSALELLAEPSPAPVERFTAIPAIAGAPLAADQWRFLLATNVQKFPLGEELRDALVDRVEASSLEKLHIEGKANGQIRVGYRTDEKRLAMQFDAAPIPELTTFQPEGFPFPLSNVEGQVSWREGTLTISGLRARNGNTTLAANVTSQTIPTVGYVLDVTQLRIDQLQIDRDLQSVAQGGLRDFLDFLQPQGFFNVDGALRVSRDFDPKAKNRIAWNLRFAAQQNSIRPGVAINGICGRVRTYGVAMENTPPLVYGELDLDSLFYKDAQLANLIGPAYYNGSNICWGRRAPSIRQTPLYLDPFVRQLVDADPLYQVALRSNARRVVRGQDSAPAGFGDQPGAANAQSPNASEFVNDGTMNQETPFPETNMAEGTRSVQANVFGGQAICDGVFLGGAAPKYRFTTSLQNVALDETIRVVSPGSKPLKGRVAVNATLQGEGKNIAALKGEGSATVREAQLYELPQIVKILQILSVQEPGENAFSSCDVDFKVLGDHVQLSRVFLEGDALTLFGDGWLTIRQQEKLIDLTLSARLGNSKTQIPIVSDVLGAASDQVSQIRVEGDLSSPVIQQDRLPGLKKAWWSIFPEQEPEPTDKAPVERSRPVRDAWRKLIGTEDKEEK